MDTKLVLGVVIGIVICLCVGAVITETHADPFSGIVNIINIKGADGTQITSNTVNNTSIIIQVSTPPQPTPEIIYITVTPQPTPTPNPSISQPTVSTNGNTIMVQGTMDGTVNGLTLNTGVYIVKWSGSGSFTSLSLSDSEGNSLPGISNGCVNGKKLLAVNGNPVVPGLFKLIVTSDSGWTVTIEKPVNSMATTLPLPLSGSESNSIISSPFTAHAGNIIISYSFSKISSGSGNVNIYDISNGQTFYVRPIASMSQVGQCNAEVPADGAYIAEAYFPPGIGYGTITISQSTPIPTATPTPLVKDVQVNVVRNAIPNPTDANADYANVKVEVLGGTDVNQLVDLYLTANGKAIQPQAKTSTRPMGSPPSDNVIESYGYNNNDIPPNAHVIVTGQFKDGSTQQLFNGII